MTNLTGVDKDYINWITEVSNRFKQSQIKAAVKVNDEMLHFYWQLGKDLHDKKREFSYGKGFYKTISSDLHRLLPEVKSFSETNLKYMHIFMNCIQGQQIVPKLGTISKVI